MTATSWHPEKAGVQLALLKLLLDRGASIENPDGLGAVNYCLRNGRGQAAEFLAVRGARLDIEAAAGVGRLDIVRNSLPADGEQIRYAFAWACEFGRSEVAEFLLDQGFDVAAHLPHHGQTGLHWAAGCGHVDTVKMLLVRGAPVDAKDGTHHTTPLSWTIHGWRHNPNPGHLRVAALLEAAGAEVDPAWITDPDVRAALAIRG